MKHRDLLHGHTLQEIDIIDIIDQSNSNWGP